MTHDIKCIQLPSRTGAPQHDNKRMKHFKHIIYVQRIPLLPFTIPAFMHRRTVLFMIIKASNISNA